jgi:thioester reductase-like protein
MAESRLNIREFYKGKNILITGCTGFLGKVILEKILRSCPDVGTVYVMVRSKRSVNLQDRLKFDVLSSQCFTTLKKQLGGENKFLRFAESKIVPINGDLVAEKLGISDSDRELIREKCNIIINSAASVNFNDPLQEALQINYFGAQRVLQLA